jgi:citronellol/citronellal dehydrogenase
VETASSLRNKTIVITGASRGIGREIAIKCAKDGANIVVAAKSSEPNPRLPGTIHTVAEEIRACGGQALPVQVDVRDEEQVKTMAERAFQTFGGIDALVNNAGAIQLTSTEQTPIKRYDLMQAVNVRATFMCTQACLPYLKEAAKKATHPKVINLSPPIDLNPKWLKNHLAYSLSKYSMSLCTLGWAEEFKPFGIVVNSLWPKTLIGTAAIDMLMGSTGRLRSRNPEIVADAIYLLLTHTDFSLTGKTLLDEEVLKAHGITDFSRYQSDPGASLLNDLFVE